MLQIPTKQLNNGLSIPLIGLGTFKEENEEILYKAIKSAIESGVRHIDCAYLYNNEQIIGRAIRDAINESNGSVRREDLFITSKLWNTFHTPKDVAPAIQISLDRLGLEYLDLYLMHWPFGFKENMGDHPLDANGKYLESEVHYVDTYRAMEQLVEQGKARSIGVSNFTVEQLRDLLSKCKIKPVCNQIEVNPTLHNNEIVDFCNSEKIAVVAYAPLGAPDRPWLKSDDPVPLQHPAIQALATKYNKTPAQIILRWLVQRELIPIPKSVTPSRIVQNAQIFDFELTAEDMNVFRENFKQQFRFYSWEEADQCRFYPF